MPKRNINLIAQLNFLLNSRALFVADELDKAGKITVAAAIAKMPSGNWINLSDKYSKVGLPETRKEANTVSIRTFNW